MTVEERVLKILAVDLGRDVDEIQLTDTIEDDLEADSLDCVEIALSLEDEFNITVHNSEIADVKTVSDLIEFVSNRVS